MRRCRRIELGSRRPSRLLELRVIPAADAGDELAARRRGRALRDRLLQLRDRERTLDAARLVARDSRPPACNARAHRRIRGRRSARRDRSVRASRQPTAIFCPTAAMRPFRIVTVVPTTPRPSTNLPLTRTRSVSRRGTPPRRSGRPGAAGGVTGRCCAIVALPPNAAAAVPATTCRINSRRESSFTRDSFEWRSRRHNTSPLVDASPAADSAGPRRPADGCSQTMRTLLGGGRPLARRDQLRPVSADT